MFDMLEQTKRPDISYLEQNIVENESESQDSTCTLDTSEHQKFPQLVTVHSSLDAIVAVCDEVRALDLQKDSHKTPPRQNQTFVLRNLCIWVPNPRMRVPTLTTSSINKGDWMLHLRFFKQIQKTYNHTFTLDACTNSNDDNVLCSHYYSPEDSFLNRDLKGEFFLDKSSIQMSQ